MSNWSDVELAVAEHARLYDAMLTARQTLREGSKKVKAAEAAWLAAHEARSAALVDHWTEEDGMMGEFKRVGPVLQRYYRETYKPWMKGGKR